MPSVRRFNSACCRGCWRRRPFFATAGEELPSRWFRRLINTLVKFILSTRPWIYTMLHAQTGERKETSERKIYIAAPPIGIFNARLLDR